MTAPFRGSGPWRGRGPFLGRGPWAGKAPFGFNAGLPFQISVTGAQLRDALATPSAWGTTGASTGWLLPGLGGARLSGDCRTSVAMQTAVDGTVGYAAHNLFASDSADIAAWTNDGVTFSANAVAAPDGKLTADVVTGVSGNRRTYKIQSGLIVGSVYTYSLYVKKSVGSTVKFDLVNQSASNTTLNFDTGVLTRDAAFPAGSVEALADGWFRVILTATITSGAATLAPYTANEGDAFAAWGYQINLGPTATAYVPTGASARFGPAIDWLSGIGQYGIRSEAARTNLLTYSTQFDNAAWTKAGNTTTVVTPNTTIAPDGTLTADTITFGGSLGSDRIFQDTATAAANGTAVAGSVWLWAAAPTTVTLFVERTGPADTEFTVCSLTTTPTRFTMLHSATWTGITNLRLRIAEKAGGGDIYAWGAQLEAGAEASSPILTYAAATTRAADTLDVLNSGWAVDALGSMCVDFYRTAVVPAATYPGVFDIGASLADRHICYLSPLAIANAGVERRVASGVQGDIPGADGASGVNKIAYAWTQTESVRSQNGVTATQVAATTLPAGPIARLRLGYADTDRLNGHLTRIRYSRRRASNGQLQALTV